MRSNTICILAALALAFSADATETSVSYTAGDTSLAGGKVAIEYDSADKITRLAINPASGETLTLSGDALSFADGAAIVPGADGESVVANSVSFAGAVSLGVANLTWTGTLSSSEYTTVFENAKLDDISPVAATVSGSGYGLPEAGAPYYVERTGSGSSAVMTVQFQTDKGGLLNNDGSGGTADQTKVVRVEFTQEGANVKAKITHTGYFKRTRLHGFDITQSLNTAADQAALTANISSLEFGPRYEYYFYNTELTTTDAVVAQNANVEDIEILYLLHSNDFVYMPYHVSNGNGVLTAQMIQQYNAIQCAKIQLSQSGSDVVAKILYTKKLSATAWGSTEPPDFDEAGSAANLTGFKGLAFRQKVKPRKLTFIASGETTLNAVSGGNVDVTFKTLAADAPVPTTIENIYPYLGTAKTLIENAKLSTVTVTGATFNGPKWGGSDWVVVDFENNGSTASFQIQCHRENLLQCMDVELSQNGDNIEITTTAAFYANWDDYADEYYNKKTFPAALKEGAWAANALATADNGNNRFNLDNLTYTVTPTAFVYATGANTLEDSAFNLIGGENNPLEFFVQNANALPAGTTTASGDAGLYLEPKSATNWGGLQNGNAVVVMNPGSRLYQTVKEAFRCAGQSITLDGATLYTRYDSGNVTPSEAYLNDVTLANGAAITGEDTYMVGNPNRHSANPTWTITGTGAATCESTIRLVGSAGAGTYGVEIDVADTVAGDGADFIMDGDVTENTGSEYAHVIKKGAGTMRMNGVFRSTAEPTHVVEGTLLLGASGATVAGHGFSLDGGTLALADSTANTAGSLAVTDTSTLAFGEGAALTLASISVSDGARLNITGAGKTSLQVSSTLASDVLSRIRIDGSVPQQDANGYLFVARGLVISIH